MKIGLFGSCQLNLTFNTFFNESLRIKNNFDIMFSLPFYEYDNNYPGFQGGVIDYTIFDELDCLIIEINNLENQASSTKIIEYCLIKNENMKIIKTFLIKFPIYPINWSGYGFNKNDLINCSDFDNIDYKKKFDKCIISLRENTYKSDLSIKITDFIENNFNKQLLFTHSLHPTNVLLYELWRSIFNNLGINIDDYNFNLDNHLILCWSNPFTTKMIQDLNITFNADVNDQFYIDTYNNQIG